MKRSHLFWLLSCLTFAVYYFGFGGISVEGHDSAPIGWIAFDVATWIVTLVAIAAVIAAVIALFLMRQQRYLSRVVALLPIVLFVNTLLLLLSAVLLDDSGPVR